MKTIEEKAKAYDEALDRAKVYWETDNDNTLDIKARGTMEHLFPELKESENEKIRKEIMSYIKSSGAITNKQWIAWLEKQDGRKPAEWSEEDEKMYRGLMAVCDVWSTASSFYPKENEDVERLKNWLKSLKTRITWKPSDEQIIELRRVISGCSYDIEPLAEMEEQLKKLKG